MDMDMDRKIIDMSEEELTALGVLGPNAPSGIRDMVETVRSNREYLGYVDWFTVDCLVRGYSTQQDAAEAPTSPTSPTSPTLSDAETVFSVESDALTVVSPDLLTKFEKKHYYHGITASDDDHPELLWRSDIDTKPFPLPPPGARFFKVPTKTAHGVFNTHLNTVWHEVAPEILRSMRTSGIQHSALKVARFATVEDGKPETFGPVVVWIAVRPNTTNAGAVRDATPEILRVLADFDVTDVVVEWYEGSIKRLAGPPLMPVEDNTNASFGLNHPFNTGLGIPIARESDDSQGTIALLFREMKTSKGDPSDRILAVTNKHVASVDMATHYEFDGADAHAQHILVCGNRHFDVAVGEIETVVNQGFRDVIRLTAELKKLESRSAGKPSQALERKQHDLKVKKEDNATLKALLAELDANWKKAEDRRFAIVDWAPEISVRVDERHYTRDIATLVIDGAKVRNFERNEVDMGNQYDAGQLEDKFWPIDSVRKGRNIPADLQIPIRGALPRRLVLSPDTEDKNGEPLYIVAKYGSKTKLTLGRYSGMDAYTCDDLGLESREAVIYNYSKTSGDFSDHGDSGSLIFTGDGDGLAMLHSGMPRGMHNHVTYGTPLWWVIELILEKYPDAEFFGMTYTFD